jgi:phospholipid-binding lipoprotein MlaA
VSRIQSGIARGGDGQGRGHDLMERRPGGARRRHCGAVRGRRTARSAWAALIGLGGLLAGCATDGIVTHRLPAATPAADVADAIKQADAVARAEQQVKTEQATGQAPPRLTPADAPPLTAYDPLERMNRFTYRFNARFDAAIFLPVANGYRRLPSPLRTGVHNFFDNLREIDTMVNYAVQGRFGRGFCSFGRFVINSTIGIGGLFDFATQFRVIAAPTGFGTTLASWGLHPGPYLVLPLLGPSTLREGVGLLGDYGLSYGVNIANLYRDDQSYALGVVNAVDERAQVAFRYYSTGSPFEYDNIRFLYVRKLLLQDAALHKRRVPVRPPPDQPAGK